MTRRKGVVIGIVVAAAVGVAARLVLEARRIHVHAAELRELCRAVAEAEGKLDCIARAISNLGGVERAREILETGSDLTAEEREFLTRMVEAEEAYAQGSGPCEKSEALYRLVAGYLAVADLADERTHVFP
jgi:hypothetical protein